MRPKTKEVSALIHRVIQRCLEQGQCKLPAMRVLAEQAAVSSRTVQKTIDVYCENGFLCSKPGLGIWISQPLTEKKIAFPDAPLVISPKSRSEQIAARLLNDILSHRFRKNTRIPSIEELKSVYKANYRTITKAISILEKQELIDSQRQLTAQAAPWKPISHNDIVFIVRVNPAGAFLADTELTVRVFQEICSKRNLRLRIFKMRYISDSVDFLSTEDKATFYNIKRQEPLGCVLCALGINEGLDAVLDMVRLRYSCPLVLLGLPGKREHWKNYAFKNSFVNFAMEKSLVPGKKIGTYLYSQGHRKVAFFQSASNALWSLKRYEGIRKVYEAAGLDHAVDLYRLPERDFTRFEESKYQIGLQEYNKSFNTFRKAIDTLSNVLHLTTEQGRALIEGNMKITKSFYRTNMLYHYYANIVGPIINDHNCSVLVCDNDMLAISFLRLLKHLNIAIPSAISLISFDDSAGALSANLTSYNFNVSEQISCIVDFLLQDRNVKRSEPFLKRYEDAGFITVRNSVTTTGEEGT